MAYEENLRRRAEWEAEDGRRLAGRKPTPNSEDAWAGACPAAWR
ncbi:MAG: hypothetical protein QOK49_4242 [Baekduia sp.]|jgi:hypothetical protein|nr:hypothetical protein [Baekduia sp.]